MGAKTSGFLPAFECLTVPFQRIDGLLDERLWVVEAGMEILEGSAGSGQSVRLGAIEVRDDRDKGQVCRLVRDCSLCIGART